MNNQPTEHQGDPSAPPVVREIYRETVTDAPVAMTEAAPLREVTIDRAVGPNGASVVRTEAVNTPSESQQQRTGVSRVKQVLYFIFGTINVLLVLRFVLFLFAASDQSPFVAFIYGLSRPFALPFQGMFAEPVLGSAVFEWAALIAIAIYSLIAYGIVRIVALIYAPSHPLVADR